MAKSREIEIRRTIPAPKRGRPALRYDPAIARMIEKMGTYGISQTQIAGIIGISDPTLRRLYQNELERGRALANLAVGKKLFEMCMSGSVPCLIFWAKTRMGWRERDAKHDAPANIDQKQTLIEAIREAYMSVGKA